MALASRVGSLLLFLLPLALAPGLFYYYDVTPKAAFLYLGAAILAALAWQQGDALRLLRASREGRRYSNLLLALAAITIFAALLSPEPRLAWLGSNWRRSGVLAVLATLSAALLLTSAAQTATTLRRMLLALCGSGALIALYGIAQYFGWDPFLPPSAYRVGEGVYEIVRPPGTLGHADYFAAFLLWPVFAGAGLWRVEVRTAGRLLGASAAILGSVAILLSGSRAAVLGWILGTLVLLFLARPKVRNFALGFLAGMLALGLFYVSPAGERLRARVFWISEDRAGGSRLLLWRDSLTLAAQHPLTGLGPDVFPAVFPQAQSRELSRAFPDFYHESPHNLLLDQLIATGIPGLLGLLALIGVGIAAGARAAPKDPQKAALLAAFIAALAAQQFIVLTIPNALLFFLGAGWLVANRGEPAAQESSRPWTFALLLAGVPLAIAFLWAAHALGSGDRALVRMRQVLTSGDAPNALAAYQSVEQHRDSGVTAGLEISRQAGAAAVRLQDPLKRLAFQQVAELAARDAVQEPEQRQNAWYNLAALQAAQNDAPAVEASLRQAILASPSWYKPHWTLARLLNAAGRREEAQAEARTALDLDHGKHAEVAASLESIRSVAP